jgi:hypothetical protein
MASHLKRFFCLLLISLTGLTLWAQPGIKLSGVGLGWSQTSINATIFRKNSVVSTKHFQFVAYYDSSATVVIARRKHGSDKWIIHPTQYKGNVKDAHNVISIMADGNGYLHMSWDHHNNPLNYCWSLQPEGFDMGEKEPMTGEHEMLVSYPEFYHFPNGNLLFAYRDGGSGNGNLVLNRYDLKKKKWIRLQSDLVDGEGHRNAYWQICIDSHNTIHVSWVWRETPDVKTNHDLCYACSKDGGVTWQRSDGKQYTIPITSASAEIVQPIPQNSNLINQTSMTADHEGNPYIATYYKTKDDSCTQFYVIYLEGSCWKTTRASNRTLDFVLGGTGSRSIPISRPQLLISEKEGKKTLFLIYRDEEEGNHIILSTSTIENLSQWHSHILSPYPVDLWEPSFDTELWRIKHKLQLYFQKVEQGQGETMVIISPQMVNILETDLSKYQ